MKLFSSTQMFFLSVVLFYIGAATAAKAEDASITSAFERIGKGAKSVFFNGAKSFTRQMSATTLPRITKQESASTLVSSCAAAHEDERESDAEESESESGEEISQSKLNQLRNATSQGLNTIRKKLKPKQVISAAAAESEEDVEEEEESRQSKLNRFLEATSQGFDTVRKKLTPEKKDTPQPNNNIQDHWTFYYGRGFAAGAIDAFGGPQPMLAGFNRMLKQNMNYGFSGTHEISKRILFNCTLATLTYQAGKHSIDAVASDDLYNHPLRTLGLLSATAGGLWYLYPKNLPNRFTPQFNLSSPAKQWHSLFSYKTIKSLQQPQND